MVPLIALAAALWLIPGAPSARAADAGGGSLSLPDILLSEVPFEAEIIPPADVPDGGLPWSLSVGGGGRPDAPPTLLHEGRVGPGETAVVPGLVIAHGGTALFTLRLGSDSHRVERTVYPGWVSILPPLLAIVLAIAFRQVVLSLFLGIWVGACLLHGLDPVTGLLRATDTLIVDALADRSHVQIVLFSLMLGGMIGLITRNGGTRGIIDRMKAVSTSVLRGQVAAWAMGIFIFFDDYANSLIVGSTMRPITDRLRISREKLSYIVDATAAPVSSLAVISTWIGFEVGLIGDSLAPLHLDIDPYLLFLRTLPYRFYPILSLFFVFLVAVTGRDFGPMLRAERRARRTGKLMRDGSVPLSDFAGDIPSPPEGAPLRWINAVLPILVVIGATMIGLWVDGSRAVAAQGLDPATIPLRRIVTEADTFRVLLWSSTFGVLTAMVLSLGQRILTVSEAFDAWVAGIRSMILAMIVLVLAWSLGNVCQAIGTAGYVVAATKGLFSPHLLPALTFLISAAISFSTGTSWATMAIVIPIVTPLSVSLAQGAGFPPADVQMNLVGTLSGVLAGSIFGDHCSPISDTTILSSTASSVDHVDHVRTQLPYALLVGAVGLAFGDIPTAYGLNPFAALLVCGVVLAVFLRIFGGRVEPRGSAEG
jgi:Na+/H+ antiporter NhaC